METRRAILAQKKTTEVSRSIYPGVTFEDAYRTRIKTIEFYERSCDALGSSITGRYCVLEPAKPFELRHHNYPEVEATEEAKAWAKELEEHNKRQYEDACEKLRKSVRVEVEIRRKAIQEQFDWIELYGSEHLKDCVREELECTKLYREERLAKERPNWKFITLDEFETVKYPRNPSVEAMDLLKEARSKDKEAALWTVSVVTEDEYTGASDMRYYFAVLSEFLGQDVQFGVLLSTDS